MEIKTTGACDIPFLSLLPIGIHPHLQWFSSRISYIPEIIPTPLVTRHYFFLRDCSIQLAIILLRIFVVMFMRHIGLHLFFSLSLVMLLSDFHTKVILVSWNEFRSIPSSYFLSLWNIGMFLFTIFSRIHKWSHMGLQFSLWEIF